MPGRGVQADVDGSTVAVGGPTLLRERGLDEPSGLAEDVAGGAHAALPCCSSSATTA